jgi:hypothetical protein
LFRQWNRNKKTINLKGFALLNRIVGEVTNDLHYFTEDKKMKKLIYVMIATALVLSIGITSAFAATETSGSETAEANKESVSDVTKAAPAVDEDGDGVCDNCPNGGTRPLDGTGKQNGKGERNKGAGFTDEDGDGVCDNCRNDGTRPADGAGRQNGKGENNKGAGFTDEDGDGVCDNRRNDGTRPADGSGRQNGKGDRNQGAGFTDENGDGVCDNNPDGGPCPQDGTGQRNGRRTSGQDG